MNSVDVRRIYEEKMNDVIRLRTKSEIQISTLIAHLYKLPEDLFERMQPAIDKLPEQIKDKINSRQEVTLKDFVPSLYDLETRDRKSHAQEIFRANEFIDAWEELRTQNDEEIAKCLLELKDKNL